MIISPRTLTSRHDERLVVLAATLTGDTLVVARYGTPQSVDWANQCPKMDVHDVDMCVVLETGAGQALELSWAIPGTDEGLAISLNPTSPRSDHLTLTDVSGTPEWIGLVGKTIRGLGIAFLTHFDHLGTRSVRPWALRISFDDESSVVVALGEVDRGAQIHFIPDNLVTIFDAHISKGYGVLDGIDPSWGTDVEP